MTPLVFNKAEILGALNIVEIIDAVEKSFVDFSSGKAFMPVPQDILLKEFRGETHVKSAYVEGGEHYCIKIASGFYDNPKAGLSSSQGMMILFDARTGVPKCILLEDGELTDYRTAAAGAVAAKHLAKSGSETVLVVGAGIQAKLQVEFLLKVLPIKKVFVWARREEKARDYCETLGAKAPELDCAILPNIEKARGLDLDIILTATPSRKAIVPMGIVKPGVHINAIGADMPGKRELDADILSKTKVITDSTAQCSKSGELQHALQSGMDLTAVHGELGEIVSKKKPGRERAGEITVFDSTGLGVQDLAIADLVFKKLTG